MQRTDHDSQRDGELQIAFLETYPPSLCGIGTFTHDLSDAVISADEGTGETLPPIPHLTGSLATFTLLAGFRSQSIVQKRLCAVPRPRRTHVALRH